MPIKRGQKIKFRRIGDCECGDHSFVSTTRGYVTLVSPEDRYLLEAHSWSAHVASSRHVYAYSKRAGGLLHRLIAASTVKPETDHENGDGSDNRRSNLRPATKAENMHNTKPRGPSGIKGVSFMKSRGKFRARITVNGYQTHLGSFDTEHEAELVYLKAAREAFGEFAGNGTMSKRNARVEVVL